MQLLFIQMLDYFSYILSLIAGSDQERVIGFDDNDISHSHRGHEFPRRVDVVPLGIQSEDAPSGNEVAVLWIARGNLMFVQRSPRAEVIPAKIGGNAVDI